MGIDEEIGNDGNRVRARLAQGTTTTTNLLSYVYDLRTLFAFSFHQSGRKPFSSDDDYFSRTRITLLIVDEKKPDVSWH